MTVQRIESRGSGGTIVFFAPTNPDVQSGINPWNLWQKEVMITHSDAADYHDLTTALKWIEHEWINVDAMITHVFPLKGTVEWFSLTARHRDGSLTAIINPQE